MKKMIYFFSTIVIFWACSDADQAVFNSSGQGGSMARFTIHHNNLYIVDHEKLSTYDLQNEFEPEFVNATDIGRGIETIFPYSDKLFIGSEQGMYIYDISNPSKPEFISDFIHVSSCDPVVVSGAYAYVTLRSGGNCHIGMTSNQLDILDISDIENPYLINSFPMPSPHGLGIIDTTLYVCLGAYGLGIYNVSDKENPVEIGRIQDIETYDVIVNYPLLLVVGPSGFYQYQIRKPDSLVLISSIITGQ